MADISLEWGGDFTVDDTGDLCFVDQADEVRQRIIRRFLTNSRTLLTASGSVAIIQDNLFEPDYGGNARAYVDAVVDPELVSTIENLLRQQLSEEPLVDVPNSTLAVTYDPNSGSLLVEGTVLMNTNDVIDISGLEISP